MTISSHPLTTNPANVAQYYSTSLFQILLMFEESGKLKTQAYTDDKGIPTIGIGINMRAHMREILDKALGIRDNALQKTLVDIVDKKWGENFKDAAAQPLRDELNKAIADYKLTHPTTLASNFVLTDTQVKAVFDSLVPDFNLKVTNFLTKYGVTNLANSREFLALMSLGWANPGKLLAAGLGKALQDGNRAEAWFQIRYGSNGGASNGGVAKRRYIESHLFGLYDGATATPDEAKLTYAMLTKNRKTILDYETKWGVPPSGSPAAHDYLTNEARNDFTALRNNMNLALTGAGDSLPATQVMTLFDSLIPARDAFITWLNTTLPADNKLTASTLNPAAIYYGGDAVPVQVLDARADDARSGNDLNKNVLVGGSGKDTLIGGKGNDVLVGGTSFDTYIETEGDGADKLIDSDKSGRIIVNSATNENAGLAASVFLAVDSQSNTWSSPDGKLTLTHGAKWQIAFSGGSIDLGATFEQGDLGIRWVDAQIAPVTDKEITGDLKPVDFDLVAVDVQTQTDDLGNIITDPKQQQPNRVDTLRDSAGNDHIASGGGNDVIVAFRGGDDFIEAGAGRDTVFGGDGEDLITGGSGGDIVSGGRGDDRIYADTQVTVAAAVTAGNAGGNSDQQGDWLAGNEGDDTLVGGSDSDVLSGGGGSDLLIGGAGMDYIFGDVDWTASTLNWSVVQLPAYIEFQPTTGAAHPADFGADVIYAGSGNDHAWGGRGNDVLYGEGDDDTLVGNGENDILFGGEGNDKMWGDSIEIVGEAETNMGDDYLDGGAGDDYLNGGTGNDILIGGTGDDVLVGGTGQDTYLFNKGDGTDQVFDTKGENNIIHFGEGVKKEDIKLHLGSLLLDLGGGDQIHIEDFDKNDALNSVSIGSFEFADGTTLTTAELLARGFDLDGTEGDDIITGTNLADRINGFGGNDQLFGGAGDDILTGGTGADYLDGGLGDDTFEAGAGDTVTDSGGTNTLHLADQVQGPPLSVHAGGVNGADLVLDYGVQGQLRVVDGLYGSIASVDGTSLTQWLQANLTDDVTLSATPSNGTTHTTVYGGAGNDHLSAGNTTAAVTLLGGAGDDVLTGGAGDDTLVAGRGTDTLAGGAGLDTYMLGFGMDQVTVADNSAQGSIIQMDMTGLDPASLRTTRSQNDLIIEVPGGHTRVRVQGYYGGGVNGANQTWTLVDSTGQNAIPLEMLHKSSEDAATLSASTVWSMFASQMRSDFMQNYQNEGWTLQDDGTFTTGFMPYPIYGTGVMHSDVVRITTFAPRKVTTVGFPAYTDYTLNNLPLWSAGYASLNQQTTQEVTQNDAPEITVGPDVVETHTQGAAWLRLHWQTLEPYATQTTAIATGEDALYEWSFNQMHTPGWGTVLGIASDAAHDVKQPNGLPSVASGTLYQSQYETEVREIQLGSTDQVVLANANSMVVGGTGNSQIFNAGVAYVRSGNNYIYNAGTAYGGSGTDRMVGGGTLIGGSGNETMIGGATMVAGAGTDQIFAGTGVATIKINANDLGTDIIGGVGDSEQFLNAYYQTAGVTNWALRYQYPGMYNLHLSDAGHGCFNEQELMAHFQWWGVTLQDVLANGWADFLAPLPVLALASGLPFAPSAYYSQANVPTISFAANDVAGLKPYLDHMPAHRVVFGEGIAREQLHLSWGTANSSMSGTDAASLHTTLNIAWGTGAVVQVLIPHFDEALGSGIFGFDFADGSQLSLADLVALAPPAPTFDPQLPGFVFQPGAGETVLRNVSTRIEFPTLNPSRIRVDIDGSDLVLKVIGSNDSVRLSGWFDQSNPHPSLGVKFANGILENYEVNNGDGSIKCTTYTLGGGFTVSLDDGNGNVHTSNFDVNGNLLSDSWVHPNSAPAFSGRAAILAGGTEDTSYTITQASLLIGYTDVNGDALSVTGLSANNGTLSTFNAATNSWTFTPNANYNGSVALSYGVSDGLATVAATQTFTLAAVNDAPTGLVTIGGTATQDQTLSAASTLADADGLGTLGYQWQSSTDGTTWSAIAGATANTFTLGSAQVGAQVRVQASYIDGQGTAESVTSTATPAVLSAINQVTGTAAADTLTGTTGADQMQGLAGNDTYLVDNVGDIVIEPLNAGTDLVQASITYTLTDNMEKLTLTGTNAINGTGNTLNNTLTGNAGDNILNGGAGADTMVGGLGNDTYFVDNVGDITTEAATAGTDTVVSSINWTLATNVENLILSGSSNLNGTGNTLANTITGNAGNNTLSGGTGADTMIGGAGDDTYVVDTVGDIVSENLGEGTDLIQSSVTYTLGANVENLTLTGASAVKATGNELDNVLIGNGAANTLTGGTGNDTLNGGTGADALVGGAGNDTYWLGRGYGADTITENDGTVGNTDVVRFDVGIAADQLWFTHTGNNLDVSIIGTTDKFTVNNWYLGRQYHVEQFKASDGKTLLDSQVQNLVSAMAVFAPPPAGQTTLTAAQQTALAPVLAANWH